jgi:hypothetical protein
LSLIQARDAVDGRNLKFNVYYSPSSSWDNGDWTGNSVVAQATVRQGETFAHAVTIDGLTNGVRYTFGVRVEDRSGNEDVQYQHIEGHATCRNGSITLHWLFKWRCS